MQDLPLRLMPLGGRFLGPPLRLMPLGGGLGLLLRRKPLGSDPVLSTKVFTVRWMGFCPDLFRS